MAACLATRSSSPRDQPPLHLVFRALDDLQHADAARGIDGRRRLAACPRDDALVEVDVTAGLDPGLVALTESGVAGPHALAQLVLLRIESIAAEPAGQSAHAEARAVQRR